MPPTPMAPRNWPSTTIGSAPALAKLPNEITRASDVLPERTAFICALLGARGVEHGLRLHQRGFRVRLALAIGAHVVGDDAELIDDHDADAHALAGGFVDAVVAQSLRGGEVDLVLLLELVGRLRPFG